MYLPNLKKKNPKNSNKNRKKKDKKENIIILGTFLIFISVVAYLFYFVNILSDDTVVAVIDGKSITRADMDWWYKLTVLPEDRGAITKQDFLTLSLIPQEALVQQAKKEGIKVTEDDIEGLLGLYIIENGLSLDQFEKHLNSRSLTIDDVKKSFETRTLIKNLFKKENILIGESFFDGYDRTMQEYMDNLIENSEIKIFQENIERLILRSFEETSDEVCDEDGPIIRLYTTTKCKACDESSKVFEDAVNVFTKNKKIKAMHWSLDTGDDLLTLKKEKGIPEEEILIFKKYSPGKLVPAVVLGCKYKKIGKFNVEEQDEFISIIKKLQVVK